MLCPTGRDLILNTGEDFYFAKPARDHVSRVRDLALQDRGNYLCDLA